MAEERFVCAACGNETEGDYKTTVNECRVCRRMHCDGCIDDQGLCVSCSQKEKAASAGAE